MPTAAEDVTAVVLNWKDTERTTRCIASLLGPGGPGEVILVDNESEGLLRGLADRFPPGRVRLIESCQNLGFAAGINIGLAARRPGTRYMLVINNDAELLPGCLPALLVAACQDPRAGLFAPVVLNSDGSVQSAGERFWPLAASVRAVRPGYHPDYLTFACVLVPVSTLEQIGMLDEGFFMYWEDVEYGMRCRRQGLRLVVVPDALVRHELSASHGKASRWIDLYSMMGLAVLARRMGGTAYAGLGWRLLLRLGKRLAQGDLAACRFVLRGLALGMFPPHPVGHIGVNRLRNSPVPSAGTGAA